MIIENVLGTFEVDEKRKNIKALSFEKDFSQVLADVGYNRYNSTDMNIMFGGGMTSDEISVFERLITAFREGREFQYAKIKSRYLVDMSWLLSNDRRTQPSDMCHVINYGPVYLKKFEIAYLMPRDVVGLYDAFAVNQWTSLDCFDLFCVGQSISDSGSQNKEFKHLIQSKSVKVDINRKQLEAIQDSLAALLALNNELEYTANKRDFKIEEIKRIKDGIKKKTNEHKDALDPLFTFLGTKIRNQNRANSQDHLPQPPEIWSPVRIGFLYDELLKEKFIAGDTLKNDFIYSFGFTKGILKQKIVQWIKVTNGKVSKTSLFDMLQLMGYRKKRKERWFTPSALKGTFEFPRVNDDKDVPKPICGQDYNKYGDFENEILSEYHKTLKCIVRECKIK